MQYPKQINVPPPKIWVSEPQVLARHDFCHSQAPFECAQSGQLGSVQPALLEQNWPQRDARSNRAPALRFVNSSYERLQASLLLSVLPPVDGFFTFRSSSPGASRATGLVSGVKP